MELSVVLAVKNGEKYIDNFPIVIENGNYYYIILNIIYK